MFWDRFDQELLKRVKEVKRIDLRVFKVKDVYSYTLNGEVSTEGFKTRKEAIIHANRLNDEIIHG